MPEEKVSALGMCKWSWHKVPHEFGKDCLDWAETVPPEPPAADAGPPSEMLKARELTKAEWKEIAEGPCEAEDDDLSVDAKAVPQEAAPRKTREQVEAETPILKELYCARCDAYHSAGWHKDEVNVASWATPATAPDEAMRRDEPLKALRQWEADTEAPANASEGNAFIDGFNAGRQAGSERERELGNKIRDAIKQARAKRRGATHGLDKNERLRQREAELGQRWIAVEEQMPEPGECLTYAQLPHSGDQYYDWIRILNYFAGKFHFYHTEDCEWIRTNVTHWQPLPSPPKAAKS